MIGKVCEGIVITAFFGVLLVLLPSLVVSAVSQESAVVGKVLIDGQPYTIRSSTHWFFGRRDLDSFLSKSNQWEYDTLAVPELVIPTPAQENPQNPQPQEPEQ